jgi:hypothetical protein
MTIAEINRKLDLHTRLLARLLYNGDAVMALRQEVQNLIDEVTRTRNIDQSINLALQGQEKLIKDLRDQMASLQAGSTIDAENLEGIKKAAADLAEANAALQQAVPANVGQNPEPERADLPVTGSNFPTSGVGGGGVPPAEPSEDGPKA